MHSPSQLFLNFSEFRTHAVPLRFPLEKESAAARFAADKREAEEVEGLRFAKPTLSACGRREAAKLDQMH